MNEEKVALLLLPEHVGKTHHIIGTLHIRKTKNGILLSDYVLSVNEWKKYFGGFPKHLQEAVAAFCDERIFEIQVLNEQKIKQQKVSGDRDKLFETMMQRYLHQSLLNLKLFVEMVSCYHSVSQGKSRNKLAPCVFSTFSPQLSFKVQKRKTKLCVDVWVQLNGSPYKMQDFTRYCYLLLSNNEYFILSFKDYQTLEWLSQTENKYNNNAVEFSQHILLPLEENYEVDRNNLFIKKEVRATPRNRVLLSELSNSFVMFTPQWVYDGFVIDGPWKETYETIADGEEYSVYRDKAVEDEFKSLLQSYHPNFATQRNGYFYLPFAEAQKKQWFLKTFHKMLDAGIELTGMDLLQHFRYSPHKAVTTTNIKTEQHHTVSLEMTLHFGEEKVNLEDLQKMLLAGQKAILLKDNSLGILSEEWLQQYGTILKHGKVTKQTVEVAKYLAFSEQSTTNEKGVLKPLVKKEWWSKWQQWQASDDPLYAIPAGIQATLRPYQQKGFEWLTLLAEAGAGACLADDMGLGKTLQTICFLAYHINLEPTGQHLIVCPSSLIYNWQQELQKFAPGIRSIVHHGTARNIKLIDETVQVIITSYGTCRADALLLLPMNFGIAVIDESHNIKNPGAQITSVVSNINARIRIALSGTPVINNTFDLYSQLHFALPGMFGSREFFRREYADAIDRFHDEEKIQALQRLTAPFVLRRTKEQVATDLPDKTEMILWCNMHTDQQNLYNEIKDQVASSLFLDIQNNGLGKSKLAVIQAMLKLRQVCNSPKLLPVDEQQNCSRSVKTEVLVQELQNILGTHKALVFSQFSSMLNLLAAELDKKQISYHHFDGQTPAAKRAEMVNAFQAADSNTHLFLISLKAGNTGLTLTAADYVFLFDPWWNSAVEQQAIDRTHRIGQTKNVFAYKMICKGTIEEKIIQIQQRKKKLAAELVSEENGFVKDLSEEDIAYLFS